VAPTPSQKQTEEATQKTDKKYQKLKETGW
jgi:hypothetical protein